MHVYVIDRPPGDPASEMHAFVVDITVIHFKIAVMLIETAVVLIETVVILI